MFTFKVALGILTGVFAIATIICSVWANRRDELVYSPRLQKVARARLEEFGYFGVPDVKVNWKYGRKWDVQGYEPSLAERKQPPPADRGAGLNAAMTAVSDTLPRYYWTQTMRTALTVGFGIAAAVLGAATVVYG